MQVTAAFFSFEIFITANFNCSRWNATRMITPAIQTQMDGSICCTIIQRRLFDRWKLLSDTKLRKNRIKYVVIGDFPCDFPEIIQSPPDISDK